MEIVNKEVEQIENIPIKSYIDLENCCRICLLTDAELILIFDPLHSFNGITIATMINECSPFKAIRFDDYPQQICLNCVEDVKTAFIFRKHCEDSHSIISAYLNGGVEPSITDVKMIPSSEKCTQTDENSFYPCEKCDLKFFTFEMLRLHRLYSHRGTKNECRICKKTFRRVGYLKGHYTMYHPELGFNENNNCEFCGKIFERRTTLRRHLENVHKISQNPEPINRNTISIPDELPIGEKNAEGKENSLNKKKINNKNANAKKTIEKRQSKRKKKYVSSEKSSGPVEKEESSGPNEKKLKKTKTKSEPITKKKKKIALSQESSDPNEKKEKSVGNEDLLIETSISIKSEEGLSEDEIPISKLKEDKSKRQVDKDEKLSDIECRFGNDMDSTHSTDSEDDKLALKQEICRPDSDDLFKNQPIVDEIQLQKDIQLKINDGGDPEGVSGNAIKISELKNVNRNLKIRTCTICLKVFRFPHHLKRHTLARHSGEKLFKCTVCQSAFTTPDYLKVHMKRCSTGLSLPRARAKKHNCKACEEKFSSTRALSNHMREKHANLFKRVYSCSYCRISFETRHECTVHTNTIHENDKEYLCTECGQRFVRNRALEIHMRRHRGEKNHKCKFCGKGFVRAGDKDLHEKYHTGDKRFKCEICGQGFVRNYSLRVHMRIHTGEKPYHCETCPRTFAQSNDLKTHVRRDHTGERYVCEINHCGESFLQLYLLNKHKRNVHDVNEHSHIQRVIKIYNTVGSDNKTAEIKK